MKIAMRYIYKILGWPILILMSLYHFPRFIGRKNVPQGPAVLCCNHAGLLDPVWVIMALREKKMPWTMAKKEAMEVPVLGRFLSCFGAFGVDRDNADINAVKTALRHLRDGDKLLIFPEGTRVKKGKQITPKQGAVLLADRADVPIVPVYLTHRRWPFRPIKCVFGKPYRPQFAGRRPTPEELETRTQELMQTIYGLAEVKK